MTGASKIAVIGGGPAGAFSASLLAGAGHEVTLFDERLAWEKPCGGGLTSKALDRYPFLRDNAYAKKVVRQVEMSVRGGPSVCFELRDPICIYSRQTLNQLLLDRATAAGVRYRNASPRSTPAGNCAGRMVITPPTFWCWRPARAIHFPASGCRRRNPTPA